MTGIIQNVAVIQFTNLPDYLILYVRQKKWYWQHFPQNVRLVKSVASWTTCHSTITRKYEIACVGSKTSVCV